MQYKFFAVLASIMLILGQGGARANGLESNGDELIIDHDSQPLSSEQTPSQDTNEKTIPDGVYLEGSDQPLAPTDNAKEDGHSVEIHDQNNNQ